MSSQPSPTSQFPSSRPPTMQDQPISGIGQRIVRRRFNRRLRPAYRRCVRPARQADHESRQHLTLGRTASSSSRWDLGSTVARPAIQAPATPACRPDPPHLVRPRHHDRRPEWNSRRERHGRLLPHDRLGRRARKRDLTPASSECSSASGWNDVQIVNVTVDASVPTTCCVSQIDPHPRYSLSG